MNTPFEVVTVTLNPAVDLTVTIDNFRAGAVNRVSQGYSSPGGKGVNVAAALADNGHQVAAAGFIGKENGALFEQLFREKKIADHFVRIAGATRFGLKIVDSIRKETTDINFPGLHGTNADFEEFNHVLGGLEAEWFVLAGSLPPGFSPSHYENLIRSLKKRGKKVALDASGEALGSALAARPSFIKPNVFELEMLLGKPFHDSSQILEAARLLLSRGIETVAVSMGEKGACFASGEEFVLAVPPKIKVLSTVGAGDAMVAGFISAKLSGLNLAEAARRATAFSLDALSHPATGLSSPNAFKRWIPEISIRPGLGFH